MSWKELDNLASINWELIPLIRRDHSLGFKDFISLIWWLGHQGKSTNGRDANSVSVQSVPKLTLEYNLAISLSETQNNVIIKH